MYQPQQPTPICISASHADTNTHVHTPHCHKSTQSHSHTPCSPSHYQCSLAPNSTWEETKAKHLHYYLRLIQWLPCTSRLSPKVSAPTAAVSPHADSTLKVIITSYFIDFLGEILLLFFSNNCHLLQHHSHRVEQDMQHEHPDHRTGHIRNRNRKLNLFTESSKSNHLDKRALK